LLNQYCTWCTELEIENRKEMIGKRVKFRGGSGKTVGVGAEVTSGGRLFQRQLPAAGNAQSLTVDSREWNIESDTEH